jgi:hypothetical protein
MTAGNVPGILPTMFASKSGASLTPTAHHLFSAFQLGKLQGNQPKCATKVLENSRGKRSAILCRVDSETPDIAKMRAKEKLRRGELRLGTWTLVRNEEIQLPKCE